MKDSAKEIAAYAACSGVLATTTGTVTGVTAPALAIVTSTGSLIASAPALPFLLAGAAIAAIAYVAVEASKD